MLTTFPATKEHPVPKRDEAPIGAPCWADLFTSDPERSRAFYRELFGWTPDEADPRFGGYFNFTKNGVRIAGAMQNDGSGQPDGWNVYLATDDAEKTVAAATENNGQVIVPPMAVADLGTMAVVTDPGQAAIGMWQPGAHRGFGLIAEAGTPSWFELHTRDYDASVEFYRTVFRWETSVVSDAPDFRYTTLTVGDEMLAGIMDARNFLPDGVPAHWSVYYATDDADASLALVRKLGGAVVTDAEDTPYGRLATASDPTGAVFKLRQAPSAS
jgi:predicted enzyme related to lactoylglutathione lyase